MMQPGLVSVPTTLSTPYCSSLILKLSRLFHVLARAKLYTALGAKCCRAEPIDGVANAEHVHKVRGAAKGEVITFRGNLSFPATGTGYVQLSMAQSRSRTMHCDVSPTAPRRPG
jgi:hypothetical protein